MCLFTVVQDSGWIMITPLQSPEVDGAARRAVTMRPDGLDLTPPPKERDGSFSTAHTFNERSRRAVSWVSLEDEQCCVLKPFSKTFLDRQYYEFWGLFSTCYDISFTFFIYHDFFMPSILKSVFQHAIPNCTTTIFNKLYYFFLHLIT